MNRTTLNEAEEEAREFLRRVKALKANGDSWNPAHWETWTSPVIAIDRP